MPHTFELTLWHKQQATLLYHYASLEYLKPLHGMVSAVIKGIDITLQLASDEGRDRFLVNERWGARDTSANWSTYAFPALLDLQKSVAEDISHRAFEVYNSTEVYDCWRGMGERSMSWATLDEEEQFEKQMTALSRYADPIDITMSRPPTWTADSLYNEWQERKAQFSKIPLFRARPDVIGETGKTPPRTGVYAPLGEPYGALQFAWCGNKWGQLDDARVFNEFGNKAFQAFGWPAMLRDSQALADFVNEKSNRQYFDEYEGSDLPATAESSSGFLNARTAFTKSACKWIFIEMLPDAYEDLPPEETIASADHGRLRGLRNEIVPKTGWWHSLARPNGQALHYFEAGQRFPDWQFTKTGEVIWDFDPNQQQPPPKK